MINIVIATCNGAAFLAEQLESLFEQTFQEFKITIRDDASTDETVSIIDSFNRRYPGRIHLKKNPTRIGATRNFLSLLEDVSTYPYVMCCDQDDVWMPHKVEASIKEMKEVEKRYGDNIPILVCSDQTSVDANLKILAPSVWKAAGYGPKDFRLGALLAQNKVAGCTILANQSLVRLAVAVDAEMVFMHDWWLALVAASMGIVRPIFCSTMYYRQHSSNAIGAPGEKRSSGLFQMARNFFEPKDFKRKFLNDHEINFRMASELLNKYGNQLPISSYKTISAMNDLPKMNRVQARWAIIRYGIRWPHKNLNRKLLLRY